MMLSACLRYNVASLCRESQLRLLVTRAQRRSVRCAARGAGRGSRAASRCLGTTQGADLEM